MHVLLACRFSFSTGAPPALAHHDWSVPQAKKILAQWATVATLLGGAQATVLNFYKQAHTTDSTPQGSWDRTIMAVSCAGLFLEVYGALLATGTIVASITLQSRAPASWGVARRMPDDDEGEGEAEAASAAVFGRTWHQHRHWHDKHGGSLAAAAPPADIRPPCLSATTTAILDRLTVLCSLLIPLGAVCMLAGLLVYSARYLGHSVAATMVATCVAALLATAAAVLVGWQAGRHVCHDEHTHHADGSRPAHRHRTVLAHQTTPHR